jgi:apolipoprotein N-acyltransferase
MKGGARFFVIVTNDGWFGHTSGPYQHAQIAVLRAIENRTWIARCANTGISEFIDPMGRIRSRTRFNEETILSGSIETGGGNSLFVRYGNVFIYVILILSALVFTGTAFVKKK